MSTTTIRLPDELKARVATAAAHAGTSAHNFILQAIAEKITQEELQSDFNATAQARYATMIACGKTISWAEMRGYLESQQTGNTGAPRPVARKMED